MEIYDESLENLIENPDLEKGYLVTVSRVSKHHDEQKQVVKYEIMEGTITEDHPDGLRREVIVTPYRAAYDEYETVQKYVLYTEEELAQKAEEKKRLEEEEAARLQAEKEAAEQAAKEAEEQAAKEQRIAKIDEIEAQILYTAMMTDTLMETETSDADATDTSDETDSSEESSDSDTTETEE